MGRGSERLVGSDVGERRRDGDSSILGFRGPEAREEKLESTVPIGDRIRAIREAKKSTSCRLDRKNRPLSLCA